MARVFVASEYAPLHRVVLAQSQIRLPDPDFMSADLAADELAVLPEEELAILIALLGRDHAEAMPERQQAWEAERTALSQLLAGFGVEVLRPAMLTPEQKAAGGSAGYSNSFVRDPWFTVGRTVVEGSLRFPHRRSEVLPSRPIFHREVYPADCDYVATPQPDHRPIEDHDPDAGPFLEGGDVLVQGTHVFVGVSGRATSTRGVDYLRKLLTPRGYSVTVVPLTPNILHLDCALGLVREGLAVVCPEVLLDGIPEPLRDWDQVEVTLTEAMTLGTNGLPITPSVYVTDPAFTRIGEQIARHGVRVEYLDFTISRAFGGSFRCSTQALHRE